MVQGSLFIHLLTPHLAGRYELCSEHILFFHIVLASQCRPIDRQDYAVCVLNYSLYCKYIVSFTFNVLMLR